MGLCRNRQRRRARCREGGRGGPRSIFFPWVALAVALLSAPLQAAGPYREEEVKAEFLERFAQFIDWPEGSLGDQATPFSICILGSTSLRPYLEEMAHTRKIKDRPIELRQVDASLDIAGCELLWLSAAAEGTLGRVLAKTTGKPVLTVGDTAGFAERGVLINLQRQDSRVGFEINLAQARRSGLHFSSRLLKLGRIVGEVSP